MLAPRLVKCVFLASTLKNPNWNLSQTFDIFKTQRETQIFMLRISLIGYVSVNFYYFTMLKLKSADLVCVISIPVRCNVSSRSGHPWQHYRSIRVPTKRKLKLGIGTKRYETKPAFPTLLARARRIRLTLLTQRIWRIKSSEKLYKQMMQIRVRRFLSYSYIYI